MGSSASQTAGVLGVPAYPGLHPSKAVQPRMLERVHHRIQLWSNPSPCERLRAFGSPRIQLVAQTDEQQDGPSPCPTFQLASELHFQPTHQQFHKWSSHEYPWWTFGLLQRVGVPHQDAVRWRADLWLQIGVRQAQGYQVQHIVQPWVSSQNAHQPLGFLPCEHPLGWLQTSR